MLGMIRTAWLCPLQFLSDNPSLIGHERRDQGRHSGYRCTPVGSTAGRGQTTLAPCSIGRGTGQLQALAARRPATDAVFCNNGALALGALFEVMRLGAVVLGRLGFCRFNDLNMMCAAKPPLTSERTNRFEMGDWVAQMIRARLEERARPRTD